ncbi:MAG: hypothetical protein HY652_10640 [Acidobacteria bacterium]|nr:hypothetical protein [Acidobacteriota bacterium]
MMGWGKFFRLLAWMGGFGLMMGIAEIAEQRFEAAQYTEPRFPAYLKEPKSVEDLMPAARSWARNRTGFLGAGLGAVERGETALLVTSVASDQMVVEAIRRALEERGVRVQIRPNYEFAGVSRSEAQALRNARRQSGGYELGYLDAAGWIESVFPDPEATGLSAGRQGLPVYR